MTRTDPEYIEVSTGAVVDFVAVPRRDRLSGGEPWLMVIQAAAERIADESWPAGDYQVMWKLMGRLDWENFLLLDVTDLAKDMHRTRESVSRAISRLVERHILLRGPRVGRSSSYKLSPDFGWKGNPTGRVALKSKIEKKGWTVFEGSKDEDDNTLPGL